MRDPSNRMSRRRFGGLAMGVSAGLLVGCSPSDPTDADLITWLSGLTGVARAEYVPNDGDTTGHSARITTTPGLSDDDVRALLGEIADDYDDHAPEGRPSLQVQLDDFLFAGTAALSRDPDLTLDRALWLRRDGRTISAVGLSGRFVIIAKPGAVADVTLGFDAVPGLKDRATHEVRSEDRWTAITWSESARLGWALDRPLVQRIADLGHRYPGLVWWLATDPTKAKGKAGLFFARDDISLAALIAGADEIVGPKDFADLELGWGPARAPYGLFADAFTRGRIRTVLDAVADLPGVAELRVRESPGERFTLYELVVRTTDGYRAGLKALRATWDSYVSVSLVRDPARFVGQRPDEVFRGSIFDSARKVRVQAALADLPEVLQYAVGSTFSNLSLAPDISDGQLTSALTILSGLLDGGPDPEDGLEQPYAINVYYRVDSDLQRVGKATAGVFTRSTKTTPVGEELAGRVQTIWERLT